MDVPEEPHVEMVRRTIEEQYAETPTGCGGSFGELLCHEIHSNGMTFAWLAEKWGVSLAMLGELIADHCRRLEPLPRVSHGYVPGLDRRSVIEKIWDNPEDAKYNDL